MKFNSEFYRMKMTGKAESSDSEAVLAIMAVISQRQRLFQLNGYYIKCALSYQLYGYHQILVFTTVIFFYLAACKPLVDHCDGVLPSNSFQHRLAFRGSALIAS